MNEAPVERSGWDLGAMLKAAVMCLVLAPFAAYIGGMIVYLTLTNPGANSLADSFALIMGVVFLATAANVFVIGLGFEGW